MLDVLGDDEAEELLRRRVGATKVAAEPEAVRDLLAGCAGLPLALGLVAARALDQPRFSLRQLADQLRGSPQRLQAFTLDGPETDLRGVFTWSYRCLSAAAARVFRLLGVHPGPDIAIAAACSLTATRPEQLRALLHELCRANLLTELTAGRFAFHDLLRVYAGDLANEAGETQGSAGERILGHYLHSAEAAIRRMHPRRMPVALMPLRPQVWPETFTDSGPALSWLNAERDNVIAAVEFARQSGLDTHAWQLVWTIAEYLDRRGHWQQWSNLLEVALESAGRSGDEHAQAHLRRSLARAMERRERHEAARAHAATALELYVRLKDVGGQARTHLDLSWMLGRHERHHEALSHARAALKIYRAHGMQDGLARAFNAVGWDYAQIGEHQKALRLCGRALALCHHAHDQPGEAATWDSLGYVHHRLGQRDLALAAYREALKLRREMGDLHNEADTLRSIGNIHHGSGDLDPARECWAQALDLFEALGHHRDTADLRAKIEAVTGA